MESRMMKVKCNFTDRADILAAQKADNADKAKQIHDDIYVYYDNNADAFLELEKVFRNLNVPFDCVYQSANDLHAEPLIMSFRPYTKIGVFIYENGARPIECNELIDCNIGN